MSFENLLAERTKKMGENAIREILKVVAKPGMVSLAGGIPAPESFPMEIIRSLSNSVIDKYGSSAFQYDPTEGFPPLREALADHLIESGISATKDEILIGSGSQGVLDALGKVLISKGDKVAVEAPTYLGAISAFNPYEPEYMRIDTDDDGLIPESLEQILQSNVIKFIYLVPNFQNPTGRTITLKRRKQVAEIIKKYNVLLVEDDPYGSLRYKGEKIKPLKVLAPDHVVYISTFSKILAPGLRIGYYVAPEPISKWTVLVKQGVDLHTSTYSQALAAEYLSGGYLKEHLPKILDLYKPKQEAMLSALDKYFPKDFTWTRPEGGMFIWVVGPKEMNAEKIYWKAIEKNVAFVPGKFFFTEKGEGQETIRLNYTMANEKTIEQAIKTLAEVIKQEM